MGSYSCCYILTDAPMSSNSDNSSDSATIIGGAVGGVLLLLMIIVVLCIMVLYVRRSYRKGDNKEIYSKSKHSTDVNVTMDNNPSYDVTKANSMDYSYNTIYPGGSDAPITTNPSYNAHTKPYSKTSEDDYNYVQPNELMQHSDVDGYIKIYPNNNQSHDIRGSHSHSNANNLKQDEYGVVNQPQS